MGMIHCKEDVVNNRCENGRGHMRFFAKLAMTTLFGALALTHTANQSSAIELHRTDFTVKFGAMTVGSLSLGVDIDANDYKLTGKGKTKGLADWFAKSKAEIESHGHLVSGRVIASNHFLSVTEKDKTEALTINFDGGDVKEVSLKPDKRKNRKNPKKYVVLKEDHLKGVVDPASALVVPVGVEAANDPTNVCNRTYKVYDGETRFDMVLSYKTNKPVKTKGYDGNAYVCRLKYVPVAGHEHDQKNVKRMAKNGDMEIWLAPIGINDSGQAIFTAIRILVPTWIGTFSAEPEYFGPARS